MLLSPLFIALWWRKSGGRGKREEEGQQCATKQAMCRAEFQYASLFYFLVAELFMLILFVLHNKVILTFLLFVTFRKLSCTASSSKKNFSSIGAGILLFSTQCKGERKEQRCNTHAHTKGANRENRKDRVRRPVEHSLHDLGWCFSRKGPESGVVLMNSGFDVPS